MRAAGTEGFSLLELIAILAIVGILIALAAPRFNHGSEIEELGFHSEVAAMLRLAQRRAVADECEVRVSTSAAGLQVMQRATHCSGAFNMAVAGTAGDGSTLGAEVPANLAFSAAPATFYFDATGNVRASPGGALTDVSINVGARSIVLLGATGYVRQ